MSKRKNDYELSPNRIYFDRKARIQNTMEIHIHKMSMRKLKLTMKIYETFNSQFLIPKIEYDQ